MGIQEDILNVAILIPDVLGVQVLNNNRGCADLPDAQLYAVSRLISDPENTHSE